MASAFGEMFVYFCGLMGIVISIVSLFASKNRKNIRYSLSILLIVVSLMITLGTLHSSGRTIHLIHLFRLDSPLHFLLGPVIYFYTLSIIYPDFKYRQHHLLHLLPCIANFVYFVPFYLSSPENKMETYLTFLNRGSVVMPFQYLLKFISFTLYFVAQLYLIKKFRLIDLIKIQANKYLYYWFIIYLGTQLILIVEGAREHLSGLHLSIDPYQFVMYMVAFFQYAVIVGLLFLPELLYGTGTKIALEKTKYTFSKLSETEKNSILNKLYSYIEKSDKPYLNEKISLIEVSKILDIGSQQLSQVINEKTKFNFNEFINSYRIEEAKRILTSPSYAKLTIEAIAQKAGFNSKSAFYTAFKKHTGLTPKEFIGLNANNSMAHSM
jgi:AraC-like DNA-binding protein